MDNFQIPKERKNSSEERAGNHSGPKQPEVQENDDQNQGEIEEIKEIDNKKEQGEGEKTIKGNC